MSSETVILGLSGGVDSAVSAALLQQAGYQVRGLYMDNGFPGADAARRAADALGIPLTVVDTREAMEQAVYAPFAAAYLRGETPNPCILCNPAVKFALLCREADAQGARWIATGHYARVRDGAIFRGARANDQSYMLCRLLPEQVSRLLLPLGPYEKTQVREMARGLSLPPADKPDSMEICFIPDKDYAAWIESRGQAPGPGNFLLDGKVVGQHKGIHHYTLGQRKHFGMGFGQRVYVSEIRPESNEVCLSTDETSVFRKSFTVRELHWIAPPPAGELRCGVRVRHSRQEIPLGTVQPEGADALVTMDAPIRAPTPGQSAAFYDGDRLLGGGFIVK